jgi:hypothetical protein
MLAIVGFAQHPLRALLTPMLASLARSVSNGTWPYFCMPAEPWQLRLHLLVLVASLCSHACCPCRRRLAVVHHRVPAPLFWRRLDNYMGIVGPLTNVCRVYRPPCAGMMSKGCVAFEGLKGVAFEGLPAPQKGVWRLKG